MTKILVIMIFFILMCGMIAIDILVTRSTRNKTESDKDNKDTEERTNEKDKNNMHHRPRK